MTPRHIGAIPIRIRIMTLPASLPSVLASVAAGVLLAILVRINATLGTYVGELSATFAVHGVGTAFAVLLIAHRLNPSFWNRLAAAPAVDWTGGLWSVMMVWVATLVVPQLGTALAVSLFIAADLLFSALSDRFGLLNLPTVHLSWQRIAGILLAIVGVLLIRFG
jgi:transporter family-2 protein